MNTQLKLLDVDELRRRAYYLEQKLVDAEILLKIIEEKTDEMAGIGISQNLLDVVNQVQCLLGCAHQKMVETQPSRQSIFDLLTVKIGGAA